MTGVLVNGVNLNVKVDGSGPPIVALHGFAGNISTWDEFVNEASEEYSFIRIDLLGHGESESPPNPARYRIECSCADVAVVLDKLQITRACWLGYSMGGRIALSAAKSMPERITCLVLEGASFGLLTVEERKARVTTDEALARLIEEQGVESFSDFWERQPLFSSQQSLPIEIRQRIRDQRLSSNSLGLANTLRGASVGVQQPLDQLLPSIKIPVLCIAGEQDRKFVNIARDMCRKLPVGRLSVIAGAGHAPHIEKPKDFNSAVMAFLRETLR